MGVLSRNRWDEFARAYNDVESYPNLRVVAEFLKVHYKTVRNTASAIRQSEDGPELISRGLLESKAEAGVYGTDHRVLPGFKISQISTQRDEDGNLEREWVKQRHAPVEGFDVPAGHRVKGVSALVDASGNVVQQWVKTREGFELQDAVESLKSAFAGYVAPFFVRRPDEAREELLTLYPCADWHLGLYAWGEETENTWDLAKAERVIGDSFNQLVETAPAASTAIILGGGDLVHSDNNQNRTAKSGNALDVSARWPEVLQAAARLMVRCTDAALARHEKVIVRILPGNHDEHTAIAIGYFLLAWYRAEERVTIDVDPGLFFWHRFGAVMLGATHGHNVKIKDMPMIMAHRRAQDWGATRYRYVHGFHIHHKTQTVSEGEGVVTETHQSPAPQDAWHYGSGFLSGRSLQAITYHRAFGEVSRNRMAILDDAFASAA